MILQALMGYYNRKAAADSGNEFPPEGWEWKQIPFVILLNQDGELDQIEDTREGEGKEKRAKSFLVPRAVKRTSGISANLLWDNTEYIFGTARKKEGQSKWKGEVSNKQKKKAFLDRLKNELGTIEAIKTVIHFLEGITEEELSSDGNWEEIRDTNPYLSFRMSNDLELICRRTEVVEAISRRVSASAYGSNEGICLVTGERTRIKTVHSAIKGVYKAQSSGANIVSFNLETFKSYGKEQGLNAPVGNKAEFCYTTALNWLLAHDSRQHMLIGDASVVFWSSEQSSFESAFASFFSDPYRDDPDANTQNIRALFNSIKTGAYLRDNPKTLFYILGLSPNIARLSVRFWEASTIGTFSDRIRQYFEDFAIVKPPKEPEYYSINRVLRSLSIQDKSENIPPNLAGDLMKAILGGTPYPATLLQAAIRRIHSDTGNRVKAVRAAVIKAYLNRYHRYSLSDRQKEITMELDVSQPSIGYQLGRLFAALEKIQLEANPGINTTILEKYYGAACGTPVVVFPTLLRLKNHHIEKLENRGRAVYFDKLLGEIIGKFTDFPANLDLHEQGRFAIGYYHQKQAFFTKKDVVATKKEQIEGNNNEGN